LKRRGLVVTAVVTALMLICGMTMALTYKSSTRAPFRLNRMNGVRSPNTGIASNADGPALTIRSDNSGSNARALDLVVQPGLPPMTVNSSTQVSNLNADLVDGRSASSFVANSTYRLGQGEERVGTLLSDGSRVLSQSCLSGDRLLTGGPASVNVNSDVLDSFPLDTATWQARINDSAVSGGDSFTVVVLCADQ
jgi:hypothetical protein